VLGVVARAVHLARGKKIELYNTVYVYMFFASTFWTNTCAGNQEISYAANSINFRKTSKLILLNSRKDENGFGIQFKIEIIIVC